MTYECLLYEVKDGIATLTLNRPERLNALGGTLRQRCDGERGVHAQ